MSAGRLSKYVGVGGSGGGGGGGGGTHKASGYSNHARANVAGGLLLPGVPKRALDNVQVSFQHVSRLDQVMKPRRQCGVEFTIALLCDRGHLRGSDGTPPLH